MDRRSLYRSMLLGLTISSIVHYACESATAQGLKRPNPNAVLREEKPDPALDQVLDNWANASASIHYLKGQHDRIVYDKIFNVEKRSKGVFYFEAPDKGRIDLDVATISPKQQSGRKDPKTGKPYKLESDRPQKWICDGKNIISVNVAEKTVEIFPIPADMQGKNIINGPLPFLFGLPRVQAKQRFYLKLLQNTETKVMLAAKPKMKRDAANWREAKIILNKATYLPSAVQLIDPREIQKTVYIFNDLKLKERRGSLLDRINPFVEKDPFRPNLRGYKLIQQPPEKTAEDTNSKSGRTSLKSPSSGSGKAKPTKSAFLPFKRR